MAWSGPGLALIPSIALRYPIRKWAAGAALAAALFDLLLSGAAVPTGRSWIMMSIVLLAMILDRPALTMRNVALAALLILLVAPASLFDPSFEMSFAAVIGFVALVKANSKRVDDGAQDVSVLWRGLRKLWSIAVAYVLTTLVAAGAVAPFAIYHFHRLSHYGVVANRSAAGRAAHHAVRPGKPARHAVRAGVLAAASHGARHRPSRRHR